MASWGTRKAIVTSYTWTSLSSVGSLVAHATVDPGKLYNTSLLSACGVVRETAEMAGKGGGKARGAYFQGVDSEGCGGRVGPRSRDPGKTSCVACFELCPPALS